MSVFKRVRITPAQTILLGFFFLILGGTLLLMLPCATSGPGGAPFLDALFTATSATCVTGLVIHDTALYWAPFGQVVLLLLIQIGGMGVVTMAVAIFMFSGRKISLKQRWVMQESISARCFWRCVFARSSVWGRDCGMRCSMLSPPFAMQGLT